MKIGVALTGGTIESSVTSSGYISPGADVCDVLIEQYRGRSVEFTTRRICRILSEQLEASHIIMLINEIKEFLKSNVDGIIITHGTDTLQYSASMLAYAMGTDCVPIIFVSSSYPLNDKRANGFQNFNCAVEFIRQKIGNGVFVSYKNMDENFVTVHRAVRLVDHMPYSDSLYSIDNQYYARFDGKKFRFNKDYLRLNDSAPVTLEPGSSFGSAASLIRRVRVYPGIRYPEPLPDMRAVIVESYHSGTLCCGKDFTDYARELSEDGIRLYLAGADDRNAPYETTKVYSSLRIKALPRMSPVAAYCKLWLLMSSDRDIDEMMFTCISEDFA